MKTIPVSSQDLAKDVTSPMSKLTATINTQRARAFVLSLGAALLVLSCITVRASDPVGIYAIIDKVAFEPSDAAPERIRLIGTFSVAKPSDRRDQYTAPQSGYLYYKMKASDKAACEKEWADLKAIAGTDQCVAFGSRYKEIGRIRKLDEKPSDPDEYPVAFGLTKVKKTEYGPVKRLLEAASLPRTKKDQPLIEPQPAPKSK